MANNELVDLNSILPYGESLLPLLLSSYLSQNDLYQLLKRRGIFMSASEKEKTIPIVRSIILSPSEFDELRSRQKDKEDRPKTSTTQYEIKSPDNLIDLIRGDTNPINELVVGKPINYQIEGAPTLSVLDGNHVFYEYSIVRNDVSKDWANSKSRHEGRVDIEKNGTSLSISIEYTSEETRELSKEITRHAIDIIKQTAKDDNATKPQKIAFDHFSNTNRIQFLFGVIEDTKLYQKYRLTDISFGPDQSKSLNESASWMKDKVESLRLKGEKLDDIEYFTNQKYKESMLIEAIEASIEFDEGGKKYSAIIRIGFDGYLKTRIPDTEYVNSIISLSDENNSSIRSKPIGRFLQQKINAITLAKYLEFKNPEV